MLSRALCAAASLTLTGCTGTLNPSFPLTIPEARSVLQEMRRDPVPQARPLVIVGGHGDPGFATGSIRRAMTPLFIEPEIITVNLASAKTFADARERLIQAIDEAFPNSDPRRTTEVDVIGNSMGGVVAWYAADESAGERSLAAVRLFTIGTPFRGADIAETFPLGALGRDLQPGSPFIARLDAAERAHAPLLIPYTRSDDRYVGAPNTAPLGEQPWWVPGEFPHNGHMMSFDDQRILADIARRLRGEEPFTKEPRTPLPMHGDGPALTPRAATP